MLEPKVVDRIRQDGRRVIITGASGWLGLATIELLRDVFGQQWTERVLCFGSAARELRLRDGTAIHQHPLNEISTLPHAPSCVLHFAFLTKDRAEAMAEADYRAANRAITETVLDALDVIGADAIFVASSGASAKASDPAANEAMRLYGSMKLDDEVTFAEWAAGGDRRAVIARIYNVTGPYINKHQAYAIASFINDALAGRVIRVLAQRPVFRGYVAISELMSLVFALLLDERRGVIRFDTGGTERELGEVAGIVARVLGARAERAAIVNDVADRYGGDDDRYRALLAEHGITHRSLEAQIRETADFLSAAHVGQ